MRMRLPSVVAVVMALGLTALAREDSDITWKIRREATDNSQILATLHVLTDRYGPRLTGSPNHKAAAEWTVAEMKRWGLENAHLEPWEFKHSGWLNERLTAHVVAPVKDHLVGEVSAWTPGTNGPVKAQAVLITLPEKPTDAQLTEFFQGAQATVKGRMVLIGSPRRVDVSFSPPAKRVDDNELRTRYDPAGPAPPAQAGPPPPPPAPPAGQLTPQQIETKLNEFLATNGAVVRVNDAGRDHGQIRAFNNRTFDLTKAPPTVILRNEDYGRVARLLNDGPVELEFDITNREYPEGVTSFNAIAEIPGTDKADEVVMLGGHLDSWHAATGATDNAIGVSVMMEAARILKAIGARPRRTIRVALWSGEEQGLLGSQAYVKEHFGTFENPKPEYQKFAGYFNIDSGTGRARGATVFGPPEAAAVLRAVLVPFADLGVIGATSTNSRRRGGSDHTSFNEAGLPGIGMNQDPIEYQTHSWHTNLDTYERIVPEDAIKSATIIAAAVYHLATRDELLPRFVPETMPKLPAPTPTQP